MKRTVLHAVDGDCHNVATSENITSEFIHSRMRMGAIRYGDWKLVVNYPGELEVIDDADKTLIIANSQIG